MPQLPVDRLLVVESDARRRDRSSGTLTRSGDQVDVADDGTAPLEKMRPSQYDLVLLDSALPDQNIHGTASMDLLRLVRVTRSTADLPVIMLADEDPNGRMVEALNGGANDDVLNPVQLPLITARIQEQISRSKIGRTKRSPRHAKPHPQRSNEGRWTWDLGANTLHFSARSRSFLGMTDEEIHTPLQDWVARVHPADVERVREEMRGLRAGQATEYHREYRVLNHHGRYDWLVINGWTEPSEGDATGRVRGTLAVQARPDVDALTGLGTRAWILERLGAAVASNGTLALMLLDLDGFGLMNDSFGQSTGDRILMEIAHRLQLALGDAALGVARIGGDEFAILAEGVASGELGALVELILMSAVRPMIIDGFKISVSASIGVFCGCPGRSAPEDLLRDAYLAMSRAKELGKNRWHQFEPELRTQARARIATAHDLRYALERNELRAYYQPKVNLRTRQIIGFEALIRWHHPVRGVVYPGEFIDLAEDTGLIAPIGEWMLREACGQLRKWQTRFPLASPLTMNVNLSVKQLADSHLVERVRAILAETGVAPSALNLELTETVLMTNLDAARSTLAALRGLGLRLKLDDFGTGYSSLGYLGALHFDSLKIDRSFVQRMASDLESHAIVESITKLAHVLGMSLVAEGVELEEHIEELLRLGCEVGQGFYFSRAVEASAAEALLESSLDSAIFQHSRLRDGMC
jgi:diguanylate cyclase (GGDEF)-like protein